MNYYTNPDPGSGNSPYNPYPDPDPRKTFKRSNYKFLVPSNKNIGTERYS